MLFINKVTKQTIQQLSGDCSTEKLPMDGLLI